MEALQEHIIEVLRSSQEALTINQLAEATKLDRHTVGKHLQSLESTGTVSYRSVGKAKLYKLTPSPLLSILSSDHPLKKEVEEILKLANVTIRVKEKNLDTTWSNKTETKKCYEQLGNSCKCKTCPVEQSFKDGKPHKTTVANHKISTKPITDDKGNTVAVFEVVE